MFGRFFGAAGASDGSFLAQPGSMAMLAHESATTLRWKMFLSEFSCVIRSVSVDGFALILFSRMTTGNEFFGATICANVLLRNTDIDARNCAVPDDERQARTSAVRPCRCAIQWS
jgi:hypothetical protein